MLIYTQSVLEMSKISCVIKGKKSTICYSIWKFIVLYEKDYAHIFYENSKIMMTKQPQLCEIRQYYMLCKVREFLLKIQLREQKIVTSNLDTQYDKNINNLLLLSATIIYCYSKYLSLYFPPAMEYLVCFCSY